MKKAPQEVITITTDFGDQFASAQLKAVVANEGYTGSLIENHDVSPFSIIEGAFEILVLARFCPRDTIHVGVVDPGVGSNREGIVIRTQNFWFVGPNNGLLIPAAKNDNIQQIWRLKENKINDFVSPTFHGRDVFIKAAVYLAQGKKPEDFYCQPLKKHHLVALDFCHGQILHIDSYGNVKVYWDKELKIGQKLNIKIGSKNVVFPIVKTFADVPPGKPLAFWGSSQTLELATNLGNLAQKYHLKIWEIILEK